MCGSVLDEGVAEVERLPVREQGFEFSVVFGEFRLQRANHLG